jgi:hypothetical protein
MALPLTLIVMAVITALTVAFLAFTSAEPVIASNQMANTQARAIAESGLERALWALSKGETNPGFAGALADPLPALVPAPYDGSTYLSVGVGEFKVTVVDGPGTNERTITSLGYVPNHTNPIAIKKIQTTVTHLKIPTPPCAICGGGEQPNGATSTIEIGGSASVTASTANGAQYCPGVTPTAAVYAEGAINTHGSPNITGPTGGIDLAGYQPNTNFGFLFNDSDMATIKALAKQNGTYYQGNQTWTSPPPNGIIFVDTPSGNVLTNNSPDTDLITVDIHGNWSQGQSWSGWLVVAGKVQISGNATLSGLIYAQDDISLHGAGTGNISGAVVATNRIDRSQSQTQVDTDDVGNAPVTYNCPAVRSGGGSVPINWFVKPGSYKEVSGT